MTSDAPRRAALVLRGALSFVVGTTKKSAAISGCAWLVKNVRHVCDGSGRRRTMYVATVV
jgi:hypothetical protein